MEDGYLLGSQAIEQLNGLFREAAKSDVFTSELGDPSQSKNVFYLGKADSKIAWKAHGNFTIVGGTFGAETSKQMVMRAKCRLGGIGSGGLAWIVTIGGRLEAIRCPIKLLGKPSSGIIKGASGSVTIYSGGTTPGTEVTTGVTVAAYSRFGAVSANKWCYIEYLESGFEIVHAECP